MRPRNATAPPDGPNRAQECPKRAPRGSTMAPGLPQDGSWMAPGGPCLPQSSPRWPRLSFRSGLSMCVQTAVYCSICAAGALKPPAPEWSRNGLPWLRARSQISCGAWSCHPTNTPVRALQSTWCAGRRLCMTCGTNRCSDDEQPRIRSFVTLTKVLRLRGRSEGCRPTSRCRDGGSSHAKVMHLMAHASPGLRSRAFSAQRLRVGAHSAF